jgi:hypothetical protein
LISFGTPTIMAMAPAPYDKSKLNRYLTLQGCKGHGQVFVLGTDPGD